MITIYMYMIIIYIYIYYNYIYIATQEESYTICELAGCTLISRPKEKDDEPLPKNKDYNKYVKTLAANMRGSGSSAGSRIYEVIESMRQRQWRQ